MKRKFLALLMLLILVCTALPALAATPDYQATADFLDALNEKDIEYTFNGIDSDGDENVTVHITTDEYGSATFQFYFSGGGRYLAARVWNVIDFDIDDRAAVLEICNKANYDYRFCCFYVDDTDNSVTMSVDACLPSSDSGSISADLLEVMHTLLKHVYPNLTVYNH